MLLGQPKNFRVHRDQGQIVKVILSVTKKNVFLDLILESENLFGSTKSPFLVSSSTTVANVIKLFFISMVDLA